MVIEPAANEVCIVDGAQLWVQALGEDVAVFHASGAARREAATIGQFDEVGHGSRDGRELIEDLAAEEAVAVLRAGLRQSDVRVAVSCASLLDMRSLDAWEAER